MVLLMRMMVSMETGTVVVALLVPLLAYAILAGAIEELGFGGVNSSSRGKSKRSLIEVEHYEHELGYCRSVERCHLAHGGTHRTPCLPQEDSCPGQSASERSSKKVTERLSG